MKTPIFTGSSTAIVTPYRDYGIDYKKIDELIDFQIAGGTSAVIVCGTTGENATQPIDEHIEFVNHCVKYANGRIKIISGVGSNDTMTSIKLATHAKEAGADGILMVTPYYNKTTQQGLVKHFSYVADRVDIPMIVYNVPSRTGVGCTAETYKALSGHPNINGVKEASGDLQLVSKTLAACGDDLNIWSGNDSDTLPMMAIGAKGVISVASNIVPEVVSRLCRLCLEKDFEAAAKLHLEYTDLFDVLFVEVNPIPVKTAMNLMGMDAGVFRLPLCEMYPSNLEKLKASLRKAGLEIKE